MEDKLSNEQHQQLEGGEATKNVEQNPLTITMYEGHTRKT